MSNWKLESIPPHDWFLCLDIGSYFDHEHDPETIFEEGFLRPIHLDERDIATRTFFNGDPDNPVFHVESEESLDTDEIEEANRQLARILGTDLDIRPLYDQAGDDPVLGPKLEELYGLKRMARGSVFEDAVNRIVKSNISHKPTANEMVYGVRKGYGNRIETQAGPLFGWPRPHQLAKADPAKLREYKLSHRKGEYIVGLSHEYLSGELNEEELEQMDPNYFYRRMKEVRGIGPTTAQSLVIFRNRTDGCFPSEMKAGEEKGLRRWIAYSYGEDPNEISEEDFQELIANWEGYESVAIEYLHLNWLLSEKEKNQS